MKVGLISDTHGRLRPEVFGHFEDVAHILHAGDIGPLALLAELEAIAPVTAVWGNTDGFEVRAAVPEVATVALEGWNVVVVHGHQLGSPTPPGLLAAHPAADIVVFGHTHRPLDVEAGGRRVLNPGGAGAPRFGLEPTIMLLSLSTTITVELISL